MGRGGIPAVILAIHQLIVTIAHGAGHSVTRLLFSVLSSYYCYTHDGRRVITLITTADNIHLSFLIYIYIYIIYSYTCTHSATYTQIKELGLKHWTQLLVTAIGCIRAHGGDRYTIWYVIVYSTIATTVATATMAQGESRSVVQLSLACARARGDNDGRVGKREWIIGWSSSCIIIILCSREALHGNDFLNGRERTGRHVILYR